MTSRRHGSILLLSAGMLCMLVCAPEYSTSQEGRSAEQRIAPGPVTIHVKNTDGGAPVPQVVVHLGGRYAATGADGTLVLDGVPEGAYQLVVEHPGFARVENRVDLPAGKREIIDIALTPAPFVPLNGVVTLEDSGRPVPGARIALAPLDVASAIQGGVALSSSWDGKFSVIGMPPGKYRAAVSAPGCVAAAFEIEVKAGAGDVNLKLKPESTGASLKVTVLNSVSGSPVQGAKVALAEAWPKGKIGENRTNAAGEASFQNIRVGRLNWMDKDGAVSLCRRQATVHAEAAEYEPVDVCVSLGENTAAIVRLNPLKKVEEVEANDVIASAQPIRTGAPVEFTIFAAKDADWFRFRLDYPAFVKVAVGPGIPLELSIALHSAAGERLNARNDYTNTGPVLEQWLPAAEYVVSVEEWGANGSSEKPIPLVVTRTTAPDPNEPNDAPQTARVLQISEEVRGCIAPVADADFFRFETKRPGIVRLLIPAHPTERTLALHDQVGNRIGIINVYANVDLELSQALAAGAYIAEVREWGDNGASFDPYTLRLEFIGDDGINDPQETPGRLSAVRSIQPGELVGQTLLPPGDRDMYSLSVPSAGVVHVETSNPHETSLWLLSPDGATLASGNWYANGPGHLAWHAPGPSTIFVRVAEWGDNNWSPSPYILKAWWEPCDELELIGRNEKAEDATPIEITEVTRGGFMPVGDRDVFRFDVDHPGVLRAEVSHALEVTTVIRDAKGNVVSEWSQYGNQALPREMEVVPGEYFVELSEWGNNNSSADSCVLRLALTRAEPMERLPLATDPVRLLKLGEAQPFVFDQNGDCDRFAFSTTEACKFTVRLRNPLEVLLRVFDELTGEKVHESTHHGNGNPRIELEAKGPTRYMMELREWGDNARSPQPCYVLIDTQGRDIAAETIEAAVDPCNPTLVRFARKPYEGLGGAQKVRLDADGDGKADVELPAGGPAEWRYRTEGLYAANAILENGNGTTTVARLWVEAVGPRERKGIHIVADYPAEGQSVERDLPCRARAMSYTGARIASISASVDGRPVGTAYSAPYQFEIPWRSLGPGQHELAVTASDAGGQQAVLKRNFEVSEYFGLLPEDGAVVTGNSIRISWSGAAFGPATVRYRMKGEAAWKEAVGESGRGRAVVLEELEPGKQYEFQPVGGREPGPVRTVTRVKGLAFGKMKYAATIKRDYDQKLGVSVRNHGEKPLTVRLECGKPPADSLLLVGFVGEGSEGVPFNLDPGEEREFMLGISAQDCVAPKVSFPIRLVSPDQGMSDESLVELDVLLPNVVLEWETKEDMAGRIGRILVLKNKGDSLTDLSLRCSSDDLSISPYIDHGIFPAGATMEVLLTPRLYVGFQSVEGKVIAKAVNKTAETEQKIALKEGEKIHAVDLGPKSDDPVVEALQKERALAAAYMNPNEVDWSRKANPEDTDGDGKIDRWTVDVPAESTRWIGNDTNGDGEIDSVQADIGFDGRADFSALRGAKGWEETNLVDSHLEMGFKLPWARSAYEKHDVDIVMNDVVVGQLRDTIPDGNYAFRVPPSAFKFGPDGSPAGNEVRIKSKHLRGGHYVVSSDFRMKLNLTGTRVYAAAKTQADAEQSVRATPGLVLDAPDFSVSSQEMRIVGEPKSGSPITVTAPLRNLGAGHARQVEVALCFNSGGEDVELARTAVAELAPTEVYQLTIAATAPAGDVTLKLVVDPDKRTGDSDPDNNEARAPFTAAGDATKPTLTVVAPADGASLAEPVAVIAVKAEDDQGIGRVDLRIDDGLWTRLARTETGFEGRSLLQPGAHRLTVRAMDSSGNIEAKTVNVSVAAAAPSVEIVEPAEGAQIDARKTEVTAKCAAESERIAARVNGGPWKQGAIKDGQATIAVDLSFGAARIEVMAVDKRGVRGMAARNAS
ncbi:MAG: carboxypeptidase regulatory-like domain-containing protein, partial [Planctomycetota bacterium]|nr:carboxypeptidase regulatory-like domain-containing protein [Planctomycetota bacterium]